MADSDDAKIATREEFDLAFDERWNSGVMPAANSAEQSEIGAENNGLMVKTPLDSAKKQGGLANIEPHRFRPGVSGNPSGRPKKDRMFKAVTDKLSAESMAQHFVTGLLDAIKAGHSKTVLMYLKEYYDRTDGAVVPMLPAQANGFEAVIMALRGTIETDGNPE